MHDESFPDNLETCSFPFAHSLPFSGAAPSPLFLELKRIKISQRKGGGTGRETMRWRRNLSIFEEFKLLAVFKRSRNQKEDTFSLMAIAETGEDHENKMLTEVRHARSRRTLTHLQSDTEESGVRGPAPGAVHPLPPSVLMGVKLALLWLSNSSHPKRNGTQFSPFVYEADRTKRI